MADIKVLGLTNTSEFYAGSKDRSFRINEYLIVEDKIQGNLVCEVVEANSYNRFMPLNLDGDILDEKALQSLNTIGYKLDDEKIYLAKCRLLYEAQYPVETGSYVREPEFSEIKKYLITGKLENDLVIGSIKNTNELYSGMDSCYKNLFHTYDESLLEQNEAPFLFNYLEMNEYPHIGVFGGSGSGKSYGIRVIIEELMKKRIPTIIFDPHYEMEFKKDEKNPSAKTNYENSYKKFKIGIDVGVEFKDLNSSELKRLLSASGELSEAMESTVDLLLGQYKGLRKGIDVNTFEILINDLIDAKSFGSENAIVQKINSVSFEYTQKYEKILELFKKYDKQTNESTLRGISWRLRRLINSGIFSKNSDSVIDTLKDRNTAVIQGNSALIQVYSSYIINKIYNLRRKYKDNGEKYFPPFIVITDEAHNFAPKGISKPSKSILREIAQEGRKYGAFLILATQRPTLLDETITAQLNSKFIFRTVRATDIQTIKEETDITSEEAKRLPYLKTGDLFASIASVGRTLFSRIRAAETTKPDVENPFLELFNKSAEKDELIIEVLKDYFPLSESNIYNALVELEKNDILLNEQSLKAKLENMVKSGSLKKEEDFLGIPVYKI